MPLPPCDGNRKILLPITDTKHSKDPGVLWRQIDAGLMNLHPTVIKMTFCLGKPMDLPDQVLVMQDWALMRKPEDLGWGDVSAGQAKTQDCWNAECLETEDVLDKQGFLIVQDWVSKPKPDELGQHEASVRQAGR